MNTWNGDVINDIQFSITNHCNAACPQCHRTDINGLGTVDWLPVFSWSLDEFKTYLPIKELQKMKIINFCGTWGDPMMAKNIYEICEYIIKNSHCSIIIDTNGSMRSEEFWWNFGVMCGNRLTVNFAVDGCTQDMHEKYRRKTSLNKVLKNMEILSSTKAIAKVITIVFKHNENYLDKIKKMCLNYGAEDIQFIESNRFENDKFYFTNESVKIEWLERLSANGRSLVKSL